MANQRNVKNRNTRCVYCLRDDRPITDDHVIPRSWYPDTTPRDLAKWKVPACVDCNNRYSRIEETLLIRLGLCLDPSDPRSAGIPQKALRAIQPKHAKSTRDARHRAASRAKILNDILELSSKSLRGVLPNFGPVGGAEDQEHHVALKISEKQILEFGEKIVRGLTYVKDSRYIEESHSIRVYEITESAVPEVDDLIRKCGDTSNIGSGIETIRAMDNETLEGLFWIRIWGKFELYATVLKKT